MLVHTAVALACGRALPLNDVQIILWSVVFVVNELLNKFIIIRLFHVVLLDH